MKSKTKVDGSQPGAPGSSRRCAEPCSWIPFRTLLVFALGLLFAGTMAPVAVAQVDRRPDSADGISDESGEVSAEQAEFGTANPLEAEQADDQRASQDDSLSGEEPHSGIEEILVRSERREQREEDATASVVAFSALEIEEQRFMDLRDVSAVTPNLEIKSPFAASNPTLFIRGVGLNDFNANSASAVAVYNDEVYMNSPAGQLGQIFDLRTIDVLRGPQGSLYGRNASAGVIRLISRKPRMGEIEANLTGTYGTFRTGEFEGGLSIPLYEDMLAWRGAFVFRQRAGTTENLCADFPEVQFNGAPIEEPRPNVDSSGQLPGGPGSLQRTPYVCAPPRAEFTPFSPAIGDQIPANLPRWANNRHNWAGRSTLRLVLDSQEWTLNVHGGRNDSLAFQFQHVGTRANEWGGYDYANYKDTTDDIYKGQYNAQGSEVVDLLGGYLQGEIEVFGDHVLRTVTGYERNQRSVGQDYDASPLTQAYAEFSSQAWQTTQEIRLISDYAGSLQWQAGGFFLYEKLESHTFFVVTAGTTSFTQDYQQETSAFSAFVHGTYELLDDLSLDAGIRYNWERKDFRALADYFPASGFKGLPVLDERDKRDFSGLSGNLTLNWQMAEEVSSYFKYSRGFKGGHFNGGTVTSRGVKPPAEPEKVDAVEVGLKGSWFDNRLLLAGAAFFYDYKDLQVFQLQNTGADAPPINVLINANNARVSGVELELETRPLDELMIRVAFGWLDSAYLDFQDTIYFRGEAPGGGVISTEITQDYSGNRLVGAPKFSASGTADYRIELGRYGALTPRYDFSFKGGVYFDPTEGRGILGKFPDYSIGQEAYWLHNIRLGWSNQSQTLEIAGWVRNVANQHYKADVFDLTQGFGLALEAWAEPRTAGVTMSVRY